MPKNIKLTFVLIITAALLIACGAEPTPTPYPSEVSWETAVEILNQGEVESVLQLHNLEVTFYMKDGQQFKTTEPSIDAIFQEIDKCGAPCRMDFVSTE